MQNRKRHQSIKTTKNTTRKGWLCARNRNRTCTLLRKPDFESGASTNSAIRAKLFLKGLQYYRINPYQPKYV